MPTLCNLLSFLPSLPVPTEREPSLPPRPPSNLSWRLSTTRENGFLPISTNSLLALLPTETAADRGGVARSCYPCLAWANVLYSKSGYYNVQVVVGDDEPEESLLRRFRREVLKAGVIQECKRRRWFENTQEKKKRKARDASRRNRKRRFRPKSPPPDKQEASKERTEKEEEEDNWELPEGELPY